MEFMKLFAKNQGTSSNNSTPKVCFLLFIKKKPTNFKLLQFLTKQQENKIYCEQDHQDNKSNKLDHFPLKSDCALNCAKAPHFPCKGMHQTEPKPKKLFLACDRRNSYPAPAITSPSPSYPPNHPWFEIGKF